MDSYNSTAEVAHGQAEMNKSDPNGTSSSDQNVLSTNLNAPVLPYDSSVGQRIKYFT